MARCPEEELPSQERLVSIFLEGLTNQELHAALYMQRHKNLNQCIQDVLDYDDNCDRGKAENDTSSKASVSSTSAASQVDEIIKGVTEKMKQMYGPQRAYEQHMVDRPYVLVTAGVNILLPNACQGHKAWIDQKIIQPSGVNSIKDGATTPLRIAMRGYVT